MVSALVAAGALVFRWTLEHRPIVLIKLPPAVWLAFLYAGVTFHWFAPAPSPLSTGVGNYIRFTLCMLLIAQAIADFFTAMDLRRMRKVLTPKPEEKKGNEPS